jgi:DnaK suppressor protein
MTQPVKPDVSLGRISRMDAINNKSVMEVALRNKKGKLSKLKIALSKIEDPSFGICTDCNSEIQSARMIYMPESNKCIRCAGRR